LDQQKERNVFGVAFYDKSAGRWEDLHVEPFVVTPDPLADIPPAASA
jgi:hypothetical protein